MGTTPAAIIGEFEAGRAHKVKKQLEGLINNVNSTTFDIAELLHEAKKHYYFVKWGFATFKEYIESQDFKSAKAYYLIRIVEVMQQLGIPREKYEPLGVQKLREIVSLDPDGTFNGKPMKDFIVGLVETNKHLEEIQEIVRGLKGLTNENALVWMNVCMKKSVREDILKPAIELAKKNLGSAGRDDEGNAIDISDGRALEVIAVEYMQDPNNNPIDQIETPQEEQTNGNDNSESTDSTITAAAE